MCNIFTALKFLVTEFSQTGEAIVKELKYNDDGYRLVMLDMLQETVPNRREFEPGDQERGGGAERGLRARARNEEGRPTC